MVSHIIPLYLMYSIFRQIKCIKLLVESLKCKLLNNGKKNVKKYIGK
mgnify:CR=1 FL=1